MESFQNARLNNCNLLLTEMTRSHFPSTTEEVPESTYRFRKSMAINNYIS